MSKKEEYMSDESYIPTRAFIYLHSQLHSTKSELRYCTELNPARDVSEILNGDDLLQ